jgi:CRISPR-associated endonuclease Cas1
MNKTDATDPALAESASELTFSRDAVNSAICVVDGFGIKVSTSSGRLVVSDGIGRHRRVRRFDKATHGLSRLVVLGATGMVTLDALNWCRRLGIGVVMLAQDDSPVLTSIPRMTDDARLRRVQAKAPDEPIGLDLARWLLSRKVSGQAKLLASRFDDHETACSIADLGEVIDGAATIEEARGIEAAAASLYWQSWSGRRECVPRFAAKDRAKVPVHWGTFQGRRSVLASANGNRKAERPVNGILNYLYALLEAEAILACQVVGLDPGLGIVHNDARGRQSLALDLMEPVRPEIDAFALDVLESHTFRKVDFVETDDGHCRLLAPVTHELAETMPKWAQALAPIAEHVAHTLGQAMPGSMSPAPH